MTLKSITAAALIAMGSIATPTLTWAQDAAALTADAVTDEHISAFVRAAIALEEVRKEYTVRIAQAPDDDARDALIAEADETAKTLVEKVKGITPEEYVALSKISVEDEGVNQRVAAEIERMRELKAEFEKQQSSTTGDSGENLQFSTPEAE